MADKVKFQVSSDFYKSLFDNMIDGLAYCQMVFDAQKRPVDWIYIEVNKNFEKLTGLKEIVGKKVTEAIPGIASSNPELFEIYGRVSLTGKPESFETYVKPLSQWFWVSVYSPKKEFFVAVFLNITDRKQIEKDLEDAKTAARNVLEDLQFEKGKLAEAMAKDEAILASIGEGIMGVDEETKIMVINKAACDMLGILATEVIGKSWFETAQIEDENGHLIPNEKRPMTMALSRSKTTTTTTTTNGPTYYYIRKDGGKFPVAITTTPVILGGKTIGAIQVFRDISHERLIDQAKSEFVSLASHQLRTPLTTIKWYTEMLLGKDAGKITEEQKKYLDELYQANERLIELVNALLNVSRIEMGTFTIEPQSTDIAEVIKSCIKEFEHKILEKKLEVSQVYNPSVPKVMADGKLLDIVCQNLLENAINYTFEEGKIKVSLAKRDSDILITVADNGIGIPKSQQPQIFTKLFRADNAKEKEANGTGLGLYIVKAIVDESRGKIWFESHTREESLPAGRQGTTFYVTFPLLGMKKKEGTKELS